MERVAVDGLELAYELRGDGEPVVLIHWGVGTAWAAPLLDQPALAGRHRLLSYHRAGYGESDRVEGPIGMADHARHCHGLMRALGIERAHVAGHSSSALVALELAAAFPDAVQSLALLEPARPAPQTELQAAFLRDVAGAAVGRYRAGDVEGAVDTWCRGVFGPDYRPAFDAGLPGAFEQTVAEAPAFFTRELPAVQQWSFTTEDARRVTQPVVILVGTESVPTFAERRELLLSWLPDAEPADVPGATHLLHLQDPAGVADVLAGFFARHTLR